MKLYIVYYGVIMCLQEQLDEIKQEKDEALKKAAKAVEENKALLTTTKTLHREKVRYFFIL